MKSHIFQGKIQGFRVVKWYEAGILSQQTGFDSCPDNPKKGPKGEACL